MSSQINYCIVFFIISAENNTERAQIYMMRPKLGAPPMTEKDMKEEAIITANLALAAIDSEKKKAVSRITFCKKVGNNIVTICQIYPELKN